MIGCSVKVHRVMAAEHPMKARKVAHGQKSTDIKGEWDCIQFIDFYFINSSLVFAVRFCGLLKMDWTNEVTWNRVKTFKPNHPTPGAAPKLFRDNLAWKRSLANIAFHRKFAGAARRLFSQLFHSFTRCLL